MTVLAKIKAAHLAARKARQSDVSASLSTLIGDIESVGKNARRDTTDGEAIAIIKKFIKNVDEVIKVASTEVVIAERSLFESFLPKQMTTNELSQIIANAISETCAVSPKDMGKVINLLKSKYEGQFDGAMASQLIKAALAKPDFVTEEHFEYLNNLRDSAVTNMFGATPYLMSKFTTLTSQQASQLLIYWMKTTPPSVAK